MKLAVVVSSRMLAEPSAKISRPKEENKSNSSEIAMSGFINGFFQRKPHAHESQNIPPRKKTDKPPAKAHVQSRKAGGLGSAPLPAVFSDAEADCQQKQPEGQDGGHQRGMDEGGQSAQFGSFRAKFEIIFLVFSRAGGRNVRQSASGISGCSALSDRRMASRMPEF